MSARAGPAAPDARPVRAVVADDERLLADALIGELEACWPELDIAEPLADGESALHHLLSERPDVAFLDIRMPGLSGLDVARLVHDAWPREASGRPPLIVFVTAYAEFAVEAFDRAAIDYLVKPIVPERLAVSVARIRERLRADAEPDAAPPPVLDSGVHDAVADSLGASRRPLERICAASGDTVHVVRTEDILSFEADGKYVTVHTAGGSMLIRRSLRELLPRLDPAIFVQVHRRVIVNMTKVRSARRSSHGRLDLDLEGSDYRPPVSRAFAHLFKAM